MRAAARKGLVFALLPSAVRFIADPLKDLSDKMAAMELHPVVVTASGVGTFPQRLVEPILPTVVVLSTGKRRPTMRLHAIRVLSLES